MQTAGMDASMESKRLKEFIVLVETFRFHLTLCWYRRKTVRPLKQSGRTVFSVFSGNDGYSGAAAPASEIILFFDETFCHIRGLIIKQLEKD